MDVQVFTLSEILRVQGFLYYLGTENGRPEINFEKKNKTKASRHYSSQLSLKFSEKNIQSSYAVKKGGKIHLNNVTPFCFLGYYNVFFRNLLQKFINLFSVVEQFCKIMYIREIEMTEASETPEIIDHESPRSERGNIFNKAIYEIS